MHEISLHDSIAYNGTLSVGNLKWNVKCWKPKV